MTMWACPGDDANLRCLGFRRRWLRFSFPTMLAIQASAASDTHRRPKSLGYQVACLAVLGRIPVFGLVLNFTKRGLPTRSQL
jgi:hypothetical protein